MQVNSIETFKLNPDKKYHDIKDKVADLVNYILTYVSECPPHWIIMTPDLISLLLIPPTGILTVMSDSPGEYLLNPTNTRVTLNQYSLSGSEMSAIIFTEATDSMHIINFGKAKDFIGDLPTGDEWMNTPQWGRMI